MAIRVYESFSIPLNEFETKMKKLCDYFYITALILPFLIMLVPLLTKESKVFFFIASPIFGLAVTSLVLAIFFLRQANTSIRGRLSEEFPGREIKISRVEENVCHGTTYYYRSLIQPG